MTDDAAALAAARRWMELAHGLAIDVLQVHEHEPGRGIAEHAQAVEDDYRDALAALPVHPPAPPEQDLHPIVRGKQVLMDAVAAPPAPLPLDVLTRVFHSEFYRLVAYDIEAMDDENPTEDEIAEVTARRFAAEYARLATPEPT